MSRSYTSSKPLVMSANVGTVNVVGKDENGNYKKYRNVANARLPKDFELFHARFRSFGAAYVIRRLSTNFFCQPLRATSIMAIDATVEFSSLEYGYSHSLPGGRHWFILDKRYHPDGYNEAAETASLNSVIGDFFSELAGLPDSKLTTQGQLLKKAMVSASKLNYVWETPPSTGDNTKPSNQYKMTRWPVLFEAIEKASIDLSNVDVPRVLDNSSYESAREGLLEECKRTLTPTFYPGWLSPSGANLPEKPIKSHVSGHWWDLAAQAISINPRGGSATDGPLLDPFGVVAPRRMSRNTDIGSLADRLSSYDWNMLMAAKDLPDITRALMVLCRVAFIFKPRLSQGHHVVETIAGQWLNYNFAVAPTLSDIESAMTTAKSFFENEPSKAKVSTKLHLEGPRSVLPESGPLIDSEFKENNSPIIPDTFTTLQKVHNVTDRKAIYHFISYGLVPRTIVRYKGYYPLPVLRKMSGSERDALTFALAGLDQGDLTIRAIGELLWDILPWSFLFDYFFDVSSYVQSYGAAKHNKLINIAELSDYRFQGLELLSTHWWILEDHDEKGKANYSDFTMGPSFVLAQYGLREFRRFVGLADIPRNTLNLTKPSTHQWLNIAALVSNLTSKRHRSSL